MAEAAPQPAACEEVDWRTCPYEKRLQQARADSIRAVAICHLPLAPRPETRGWAWVEAQVKALLQSEPSAEDCAARELRAKEQRYDVAFDAPARAAIIEHGLNNAAIGAAKGQVRDRRR